MYIYGFIVFVMPLKYEIKIQHHYKKLANTELINKNQKYLYFIFKNIKIFIMNMDATQNL